MFWSILRFEISYHLKNPLLYITSGLLFLLCFGATVSDSVTIGGAVGNLIDRLRFGAVVDFLDVGISESVRWPCFNVADSAITVGVFLLIISSFARSEHGVCGGPAAEVEPTDRGIDRAGE